jgi:hypothetical protein
MASHELVYLGFGGCVHILELVHSLEFDHVESIWQNPVWLALQQVFGFISCDVGDRGKHVGAVGGRSLDAVAVVDSPLSCFVIDIEILEVVVKINTSRTEIATKQGRMGSEDRGDVNVPLPT